METKDLNRLKVVLAEKKRTNKWLAEQLGKDPATISKWCTNNAQPNLENLIDIAKCLEVDVNELKSLFKTIAALCPGLTIELDDNGKKTSYFSKNGISDLVDEAVENKELIKNRFVMNFVNDKNKLDLVMTYTSNYSLTMIPYVNTGLTANGPHISQIKALLTREFNKFFRDKKWLKEKDENLSGDDIQEGLYIVFNLTAPNVAYDA